LRLTGNVVAGILGVLMAGGGGYAASHWIVGRSGGGQASSISNLTVRVTASPAATPVLGPGGNGDAVSPRPSPMPVTAVQVPATPTSAHGSRDSNLTTAKAGGCPAIAGDVTGNHSTGTSHISLRQSAGGGHHRPL
jgi:hypothetical protein